MYLSKYCLDRSTLIQFCYGCYAMTTLTVSGMSMGFSSVALPLLTKNDTSESTLLYLNGSAAVWFASITSIAIIFGCIMSSLTMTAGRKMAMTISGIVAIIGWIIIATSYQVYSLLIGRFLTGFAIGLAATPAPVYTAEIATSRYRATLTSCTNFFICIGILLIYFLGFIISNNWRLVASSSVVVPTISVILIALWLPESPRWLLDQNQPLKAKEALLRLRGLSCETSEFSEEFSQLVHYHEKTSINITNNLSSSFGETYPHQTSSGNIFLKKVKSFWIISKLPEVWKPFIILNIFFLIQQFCGIYVLMAYTVELIINAGITIDPYLISVFIGVIQTIGALALTLCSSRMGRKPASIISGIGMTVSLGVLGTYIFLNDENNHLNTKYFFIPIAALLVFVATGSFGFLSIPWAMIGELYPTRFVNILGPLTTCLEGLFNFASIQIYPILVAWSFPATIFLYFSISFIGIFFVIFILPETYNRSKSQIENNFKKN
ncbi:facilitated trehalose transporter Tret1-like isoform X1 [Chelonus insularis]|uniref:facilitated trehalose transporter Tret1-like isoform X1 n=1 Tax=Chelonus insularis TaxID=460826 RepID=UPI001588554B|nr:facilitated trehalose transporter Tret1-like isoform X1 [Chelonus insularis]XP_034951567.1 facilitated trehalose transporter Tret1-like isoform X1 [Chelonus insularis]XP_034951568.1 facilitated trehalose transporter Tret1-like isoform X1 [Chelonus insularis]XP_034951569.1 facilitated trehalose transporter Tret1-like isoform X1 [Chelonus insularis]